MVDIEFTYKDKCSKCGKTCWDDANNLYLGAWGGYGDMVDFEADILMGNFHMRLITFCHKCGHKMLQKMGKGVLEWHEPLNTGSHNRGVTSLWHFGWDNVSLRGYISAMWHYFRIDGFAGAKKAKQQLDKMKEEWRDL